MILFNLRMERVKFCVIVGLENDACLNSSLQFVKQWL